ncbi:Zeta toxin family protein (plasmid) [Pseudonocardia dioxanivorans CB1190]|uniref:UDP-N-acetylglucosamine kinase n=1 Tax=Pseudonocardia dioxanivorans (strain ATCC 55486 / DSM 44775 / JCM 13855 / CB1190) TaxID=675635 RepID=F2L756_PSEUX|nr:zeta toxin family protein [Pseudonocardia dioxanivorans]AEA29029.1 Zeta toxin family protein [Pseudonocardia dioxanivorans CB1190]
MSGDGTSPDVGSYQLSADDNDRVFRRDIVPSELELVPAQEQPIVVFLIGQPGAGKSATADEIRDVFGDGGFVEVDRDIYSVDIYEAYHPRYAEILGLDDKLMAAAVGPDGRAWMAKVQDYVRAHRLHALVHEIAQNPDYLVATATKYRNAGYQVAVVVLAVPEGISRQGILDRYFQQVADRGAGRLSVPEKAAESYARIPEGAARLEADKVADAVAVFRRGLNPAGASYWNHQTAAGKWQNPPRIAAAIHAERQTVTPQEMADFAARQIRLRAVGAAEFGDELATIENLVSALTPADSTPTAHPARRAAGVFAVQVEHGAAQAVRQTAMMVRVELVATAYSMRPQGPAEVVDDLVHLSRLVEMPAVPPAGAEMYVAPSTDSLSVEHTVWHAEARAGEPHVQVYLSPIDLDALGDKAEALAMLISAGWDAST